MATARTIASFFQPPKRLKVTARSVEEDPKFPLAKGAHAAAGEDGSEYSFRVLSPEELSQEFPPRTGEMQSQDSSSYSVSKILVEGTTENNERDENAVSAEQRMRMDLNKSLACAKRNRRVCEDIVQASQGAYPDLKNLLVEPTWLDVLKEEFNKPYMEKLSTFVKQEAAGKIPIYPPPAMVFNAFNSCPFDRVKVVLLGQDPYHGPGQAMGLSFSVPKGIKIPSSLMNMYKEIRDDVGCSIPSHGNLEKWAHQGVLLLNAVLTVRDRQANSHSKKGWEPFTDAAIRAISNRRSGVVFLLWGNSAQEKIRLIDSKVHHVLKAAHPSGLSAHRGFFNCRHFSKTNSLLCEAGMLPIDWQL